MRILVATMYLNKCCWIRESEVIVGLDFDISEEQHPELTLGDANGIVHSVL